ncbi:MAG: transposase family protein [Acidobacteriota bacterium]
MHDTDLYRQILGLGHPWFVARVDLNVGGERVEVWVDHQPGVRWPCPECQKELACRGHAEGRSWRHLDTCQFKTLLHARVPRVDCPDHGVLQVRVPWAESRSRFTLLMERFVIDVLQQCATVAGARRILRISRDEGWGVMDRAVARGLARKQKSASFPSSVSMRRRSGRDTVT